MIFRWLLKILDWLKKRFSCKKYSGKMSLQQLTYQEANKYFGPDSSVKYLYHYTTIEALINGIIAPMPKEGEEICIRATHNQYMNDPSEFQIGVALLKEISTKLEQKEADIRPINELFEEYRKNFYFLCFSEQADSLPMWNMYGANGQGIALKFKRFEQTVNNEWLVKCEYEKNNVAPRFAKLMQENQTAAITYLALMPFILKHPAYSHEEETRFVGAFPHLPTKYRYKNGLPIPYKVIVAEKEILESIVIGPAANQDAVEQSLRKFLDDHNLNQVTIERSQIPYRL